MSTYFRMLQLAVQVIQARDSHHLTKMQKRHIQDASYCHAQEDLPLLERYAGDIKGYYVVIIILSGIIVIMTIAWFYFLYYLKKRLANLRK